MEEDLRDVFIEEVVRDRSFVDIGGLWGEVAERVSVASRCGASQLTMVDVLPEDDEWWRKFHDRMREKGISGYRSICGDINEITLDTFDVVHSSGVLYHLPNPLQYLVKLHSTARHHVILTSAIVPGKIRNRQGKMEVSDCGPLFVPALSEREKKIYDEFYTGGSRDLLLGGINHEADFTPTNYSPWWWLLPVKTIRSMCEVCGFEVVNDGPNWGGRAHTFLLRVSKP